MLPAKKILLVGISTRALAQSAVNAGYQVVSLDFFGDSDQPLQAEVYSLVRDFGLPPTFDNLARAARSLADEVDHVVIESGLENDEVFFSVCPPEKMLFNSRETVKQVRDLRTLSILLKDTEMCIPETFFPGETLPDDGKYLIKDSSHSGGMGVREWDGIAPIRSTEVLQARIDGILASAVFLANGKEALLLGITRQFAGVKELGAPGFAWGGNVAPYGDKPLQKIIKKVICSITSVSRLKGLNGIDFITHDKVPYLLEVNPRPPASFELFEKLSGVNAFQMHVDACQGILPKTLPAYQFGKCWGKGIVYAANNMRVGNTRAWASNGLADIPHTGEEIPVGAPVCTILRKGDTPDTSWQQILNEAEILRKQWDI